MALSLQETFVFGFSKKKALAGSIIYTTNLLKSTPRTPSIHNNSDSSLILQFRSNEFPAGIF